MTPAFSLHLHLTRFGAALAVFFEHLASYPFTQGTLWARLSAYGTIAVRIFFLLSGYVITYVVANRERTARQYLVGRASRLYSVIPIASLLILALAGRTIIALLPVWAPGYALYHARICLLVAISPWPNTSGVHLAFVGLTTAFLVVAVTPVCEALKRWRRARLSAVDGWRIARG